MKKTVITFVALFLVVGSGHGETDMSYIDIHVTNEHEIRYTSGNTIYVEALLGDRWVGRYWAADGRINFPYELWAKEPKSSEDAFQLEINYELLSSGWKCVSALEEPSNVRDSRHFVVELSNSICPVTVRVNTLLDGTAVLTRWLEITNNSEKSVALTAVSPLSGRLWDHSKYKKNFPEGIDHDFTLGYFTRDDQGFEGWFKWKPLPIGTTSVECQLGQGFDDPFFIVRNEAKGEYFICHLAWSANWKMEFECELDPWSTHTSLLFRMGPTAFSPQRVIAPGETIITPAIHLGNVDGDLDKTIQAMHDHIRQTALPPRKPERSHLIQASFPGDQGYIAAFVGDNDRSNEENTFKDIDVAAAVGAEVFILDAGWWDVPGDWYPSPSRFPNGLEPIVEYAHKKGLLFGLYVEIERVNTWNSGTKVSHSKVAKEHPEWIGPKNILNLTIPECAAYAEAELTRIIDRYNLDLYRLDYNPFYTYQGPETPRDGFVENNYWRYYEAFYGMFERIQKKYPNLILQQCAAGGGRNDLGTVSRFHETYLTDGLELPRVLQNYSGQTLGLPPEIFIIGLGEGHPRSGGHRDTHLRNTFTLSSPWLLTGIAPSIEELSPSRRDRYHHYVKIYKEFIKPLLPTCKMYHHSPVNSHGGVTSSGWFAMEYASHERDKGWATIVRIGVDESDTFLFKPRGLDPGKKYRVTFDSLESVATIDGLSLIRDGLPIRLEALMSSELILFEAMK